MGKKLTIGAILAAAVVAVSAFALRGHTFAVLQPRGEIGQRELDILIFASVLSLFIVIPVFILTIAIVWRYRATNKKSNYAPDWDHDRRFELVWWAIPIAFIFVLSVVTWKTTHSLDPFKPLKSDKSPITIQVVALQWKWLFIYPEQNIASVNFAQFPVDTPVRFQITSDAPMNSFWIPQLGGQIYAMSGMNTELNLMAHTAGEYTGVSANISGKGFANMHFIAKASSGTNFNGWVENVKQSRNRLSMATYEELAKPSQNNPVTYYSSVDSNLYDEIVMKYMPQTNNMEAAH